MRPASRAKLVAVNSAPITHSVNSLTATRHFTPFLFVVNVVPAWP